MIYTINNCIRAFGYTNFDRLIEDMGSVDNLREYVRANGYADIAVAEDTELLLVDVNGKTWHTGCYGAKLEPGPGPEPEPERDYLCFTSTGDSTVSMTQRGIPHGSVNKVIQYKLNNGQWQNWDLSAVSLSDGDKMYLKSDDEMPIGESINTYKSFVMTGSIAASGNIMSLLNFSDTTPNYCFNCLFDKCNVLTQAPELPAINLGSFCYMRMFRECSGITVAPTLPATTMIDYCYREMFKGCTSLVTAPELPATILKPNCYVGMFRDCTHLTTAHDLPATDLQANCYDSMFRDCTALTNAPELPATSLAPSCYYYMFFGCTSLTTAPVLPANALIQSCYKQMFFGCSNLNYVKALFTDISTEEYLTNWLYNVSPTGTFIKSKDATWSNTDAGIPTGWTVQVEGGVTPEPEPERDYLCFTSTGDSTVAMHQEGTPNTSANKVIQYKLNDGQWQTWDLSAVSLADGDKMYLKSDDEIEISENFDTYKQFTMTGSIAASGNIMSLLNFSDTFADNAFYSLFNGCTTLTTAPKLPTTSLTWYCYRNMFSNCTSLTTTPELPATTLSYNCYDEMFSNCTSLTTAPELPVTTLSLNCYIGMFSGCTSLTTAPTLPATTLTDGCYQRMFSGCTSLTTAPELPATTLETFCYDNMFKDCTNLNYVKAMFTTDTTGGPYITDWLSNVAQTGTFVKNSAATWTNDDAGIPSGWTVQTATPDK